MNGYSDRINHALAFAATDDRAKWVCAADKAHNGNATLADLKRTMDSASVWGRFAAGRAGTVGWYRDVLDRLVQLGFDAPIVAELRATVAALDAAP